MKPYVFSVQYTEANGIDVVIDRGIMFGESYSAVVTEIEKRKLNKKASIIDLYVVSIDKEIIHLSEEAYEKVLNGDIV